MAEAHDESTTPPSADAAAAGRPIAADVVEAYSAGLNQIHCQ